MSTSRSIERYRLLPLQVQIVGLALCWTLTIVAIGIPHWGARVASVFTGCLAVAFLFFPETQIDLAGSYHGERALFGFVDYLGAPASQGRVCRYQVLLLK
jgi:hypothetical protein